MKRSFCLGLSFAVQMSPLANWIILHFTGTPSPQRGSSPLLSLSPPPKFLGCFPSTPREEGGLLLPLLCRQGPLFFPFGKRSTIIISIFLLSGSCFWYDKDWSPLLLVTPLLISSRCSLIRPSAAQALLHCHLCVSPHCSHPLGKQRRTEVQSFRCHTGAGSSHRKRGLLGEGAQHLQTFKEL